MRSDQSLAEPRPEPRGAATRSLRPERPGQPAPRRRQPQEPEPAPEGRGDSDGGSKKSDRPPRRSPSPPPSGGGGGGGGGNGRRSRSRSKSPRHGSRDARDRLNEYRTDYIGPARIWLSDLEKNSIFCWFDLKNAFEKHFRGTYKRPATTSDLQACIQKKGETSRNFLTRWLACRNECENVDNRTAMHAFIGGLQRGGLLRHKLTCLVNANKLTLDDMITIASDHTAADDDAGGDLASYRIPASTKKNRDNGSSSSHKRKNPDDQKSGGSEMVAMAFQRGGSGGGRGRGRGGGAGRGQQHARGKSTHTNRNCKWVNDLKNDPEAGYKRARKHRPRGKGGKGKNKDKEEDSSEAMDEDDNSPDPKAGSAGKSNPFDKKSVGAYHTFLGTPTVRATKSATRILNATVPAVPQYVRWSEIPCTFDREDHPAIVPKECYALVHHTSRGLGDVHNFREEKITFEVVPFKSSYHVIFGRPTYHKFHARACYIYNKLKIPGPKGATYQRTMQRCLKDQIGRNVHAYVDDIAVMTRKGSDLISDLTETFDNLRRYKMMLNPLKFVSRLGEKALPLYKLLKKTDKFVWDDAADAALRGLKEILTSPPILAAPAESEPMLLYLAATNKVISLVIVVERKEEEASLWSVPRQPEAETLLPRAPSNSVSKAPLSTILNNADATGRTAKWGIELSAFDIAYKPRTAVKSQVLADFVADWTEAPDASLEPEPETWVMHFDGSKQHQGSGAGVTLKSPTGEELQYVLQIHFEATNNMAEYEALLHGLRIAKEIGIKHIICCGDSDLVAQQVAGTWNARNSIMAAYRDEVDEIAKCFLGYEVKYVRRDDNTAADMLSKLGSGEANSAWHFPGASPDTL
ncbi:hypothetical protein QYE76_008124, partial [Lolium multiflorum]